MKIQKMTPMELKGALGGASPPVVVDVRTPEEYDLAHMKPSVLIPMDEITARWSEIPKEREVVLLCHHGIRSMHVALWLESKGFERLYNLTGGLDRWSMDVDPDVPRY